MSERWVAGPGPRVGGALARSRQDYEAQGAQALAQNSAAPPSSLTDRANSAAANARQIERGLEEIMGRVADVERRPPDGPGSVAVPQSHVTFALTEIEQAHAHSHELIQEILARL